MSSSTDSTIHLYMKTPCGRYGKVKGETFLRRSTTKEPMDTPRRYHESEEKYQQGRVSPEAAWHEWKRAMFGNQIRPRSEWFELVDAEMHQINRLVQSYKHQDFDLGLQKLRDRVYKAAEAWDNLELDEETGYGSHSDKLAWQDTWRKGPWYLIQIANHLTAEDTREEGRKELAFLCDEKVASKLTSLPPMYRSQDSAPIPSRENIANIIEDNRVSGITSSYRPASSARTNTGEAVSTKPRRSIFGAAKAVTQQCIRPLRSSQSATPVVPSSRTALYMRGEGTKPPTYIRPSNFFREHGDEHGIERPPRYNTMAPTEPARAQWMPREGAGEDVKEMEREGRRNRIRARQETGYPDNVERARDGGGEVA